VLASGFAQKKLKCIRRTKKDEDWAHSIKVREL
jgi:hypothetical protein